ncbi:MAG: hypothetical protein D6731_05705 [Planctomycetota bacterium]|nr:MAG: hypothetical protein D6731_05705 [Planctomycetota bacterium]
MIRYEDLAAARWLHQRRPEQRALYLAALETVHGAPAGQRTFLGTLVAREAITAEQAHYVRREVERGLRARGLSLYAHLLARAGLPRERLEALVRALGPEGDANALGDRVVASGLLPAARERQLRFQARLALDRDMARQVERHLRAHPGAPLPPSAQRSEGTAAADPPLGSGVVRFDLPRTPSEAGELQAVVDGTLSDADAELPGPSFRIPDWVDMAHPKVGKSLAGYRILGLIGKGNMGEVYLADERTRPERPVALKLLGADAPEDARGRFRREILANSFFAHPGALEVFDAGETARGHHYLVMEFFDGQDLEKLLSEGGRLPAAQATDIARQVFETLAASHAARVVHRDVKPGNILVSWEGDVAKLMDFGIAVIGDLDGFEDRVFRSMEGLITGTPEYMSPEQASGEPVSPASDLYSMGATLYHMLSGRLPFLSETPGGYVSCHMLEDPPPLEEASPACADLPQELRDLVLALLAKDPAARPASAADVAAALARMAEQLRTRPSGRLFSFFGWRRR